MTDRITQINRQTIKLIDEDAQVALQLVAEQYGLILKRERGTYDSGTFTTKWSFTVETEAGVPADFARHAPRFGLTETDYGREFATHQGSYELCGFKPRSPKYPILGRCTRTGKTYKFRRGVVENMRNATANKIGF